MAARVSVLESDHGIGNALPPTGSGGLWPAAPQPHQQIVRASILRALCGKVHSAWRELRTRATHRAAESDGADFWGLACSTALMAGPLALPR